MQQETHLYFEDGTSLSYVLNIINSMKKYRQPFYKTYIMVFLGTIMIISVILFPIIIEHFNKALSNGVEIDYLIKISILFFCALRHFYLIHNSVQLFLCRCIKFWNRYNKWYNPLHQKEIFVQGYY